MRPGYPVWPVLAPGATHADSRRRAPGARCPAGNFVTARVAWRPERHLIAVWVVLKVQRRRMVEEFRTRI
jgi:hypothetical protein